MSSSANPSPRTIRPPEWPPRDEAVRAALEAAWRDGSWAQYDGEHAWRLTEALATRFCTEHVLLCSSGTVAAQIALRGLGIGAGDEVLLAGYDYPGNFRSIESVGARPVLVDVVAGGATPDVAQFAAAYSPATKALIVSHLHGVMAPMPALMAWAAERGVAVVEDTCQAPGASIGRRPAGAWGDVGMLSFGGSKLLTAGRGGAVITNRADVAQRARVFCQQGNHAFPLSELQAAVLLPQLAQLEVRHAQRAASVRLLLARLAECRRLQPMLQPSGNVEPAYYKLGWLLAVEQGAEALATREKFIAACAKRGVPIDAGFRGFVHRTARRCRTVGNLGQSAAAAEQMLVLHHPILLEPAATIEQLASAIIDVAIALDTVEA